MDSKDEDCSSNPPPQQETGSYSFGLTTIKSANNTSEDGLCNPLLPTRPRIRLSKKSLDQCTEILGSETGTSDVFDDSFPSSSLTNETRNPRLKKLEKKQQKNGFPQPLTTMAGPDCIRLKPWSEDGRLVLKAVRIPPSRSVFQATRSNGCLRLQFLGNAKALRREAAAAAAEEEKEEDEGLEGEAELIEEGLENEESVKRTNPDGIEGNEGNKESRMEIEKFQRPSGCKGGTQLMIWKPFLVAIC